MIYQKDIKINKDYILLTAGGSFSETEGMSELMKSLTDIAESNHLDRLIIDLSCVKGRISSSAKYELGELAARLWGYKYKIAVIYLAGENTGMFENVAVNRGGNVHVVSDFDQAEKWLLQK